MAPVNRAIRLTFSYDGNQVRLISRRQVEMVVPPSDPVVGFERQQGSWVELKDSGDRTLYRRVMPHLVPHDVEVFSGDPKRTVERRPVDKPSGLFSVLIPDVEEGRAVTLSSSHAGHRGGGGPAGDGRPAVEIARFELG